MQDSQSMRTPGGEQFLVWRNGAAQFGNVVAEHLTKAARLQKIPLHVNDQERTGRGGEFERVRFGIHSNNGGGVHGWVRAGFGGNDAPMRSGGTSANGVTAAMSDSQVVT